MLNESQGWWTEDTMQWRALVTRAGKGIIDHGVPTMNFPPLDIALYDITLKVHLSKKYYFESPL